MLTHWAAWVEVVQVLLEDDGDILTGPGGEEVSYHAEKQQSPLLCRTVMHTVVVIVMKY